ncbi:MAG TPA: GGDEF domain-containing protein [Dictyoglomaceae bacterium]|nr:GGDEF domain-containing protein [Dictyoglomaceae bacterium]HOL39594.1 GGDEF domain-containing protein [Dictyoglomaceae bacterium]HOP94950.1 GGDEF domain-containing protein [Dictyoglomaceae bacterium]HPP16526.1 GGDEF domain-containing protein [Dictyoglomaceae bacterium]
MKIKNKIFLYYIGISLIFFAILEIIFINLLRNEYVSAFETEIVTYTNIYMDDIVSKLKDTDTNSLSKNSSLSSYLFNELSKFNTESNFGKIEGIMIQEEDSNLRFTTNLDFEKLPDKVLTLEHGKVADFKNHKYYFVYPLKENLRLILGFKTTALESRLKKSTIAFSFPLIALQIFFTILFYSSTTHTYVKPLEELAKSLTIDPASDPAPKEELLQKNDEIGMLSRKIADFDRSLKNTINTQEEIIRQEGKNLNILLEFISQFNLAKRPVNIIGIIDRFFGSDFPAKVYDIYLKNPIEDKTFYEKFQIVNQEESKEIFEMLLFYKDQNKIFTAEDLKYFSNLPQDYLLIPLSREKYNYGFIGIGETNSYKTQDIVKSIFYHLTIALENAFLYEYNERLSNLDSLTGVYNKRKLDEFLEIETERALRFGHPLSLLFIDLDNFKNINDKYGHILGDNFLKEFASFLVKNLRNIDIIGRFGGEEFVCLLIETEVQSAFLVGEKLRDKWNKERHIIPINVENKIGTLSIGISNLPVHTQNTIDLLILADRALYEAKRERNKTLVYSKNSSKII